MNGMIDWFARNTVAANLLMICIMVGGLIAGLNVKQEIFPQFELDMIRIQIPYLGAAPEEVEEAVCIRIEEAIQGIDGIKEITSTASEGMGTVLVELELGADAGKVNDEIKSNVDAIDTFPAETEKPIISELTARRQVVQVAVSGHVDEFTLKAAAERVRDELSSHPAISQVDVVSARPYEISIEVSEIALRRHGLTFDDVAAAVRQSSLDLPGGSVRSDSGEILLRTIGQAYRGDEYERLLLVTRADGTRLRLGDVATVIDGFAETDQFARFDVQPTSLVSVFRTGDQSVLEISSAVAEYVARAGATLPQGISLTVWNDEGDQMRARLRLMVRNGVTGFALVFVLLALLLELRLAMWVSLGIPISFLGAIMLMPGLDVSINVMSQFAFILVLGIVVDDAIIVGENIYRHQEEHGEGLRGSIEGAQEIATPVTFAVLTTVAAFSPLMFVPGMMGKIFVVLPLIVIPCLLFSLIESLQILPAHLSHLPRRRKPGPWRRFQRFFANGLQLFIQRVYKPSLEFGLRWRYLTAAAGVSTLVLTVGMVIAGWVNFQFFPSIEADFMSASVTMPQGTPAELTSDAVRRIEVGAGRLRQTLITETGTDYFRHVFASVGDQPMAAAGGPMGNILSGAASHVGEVTVELAPSQTRSLSSDDLGNLWREDRSDSGGGRAQLQLVDDVARQRSRHHVHRTRRRRSPRRRRGHQDGSPELRRALRHHRLVPAGQAGNAARDPAGRRGTRAEPAGSRPSGATGVLRRGGPTDPAGPGRHPCDGAVSGGPATLARESREHAHSHTRRWRSSVQPGRRRGPRPGVRLHQTGRPQPCRQRLGRHQCRRHLVGSGHRRPRGRCAPGRPRALPGRELHARG